MSDAKPTKSAKSAKEAEIKSDEPKVVSRTSWFLGWIVAPGLVAFALWVAGVIVGVHYYDSWFVQTLRWFASVLA